MTEAVFGDFEARTGHRILERYGMTEAGMITSNPLRGDRVAGTVGFPLPDVEVRAVGEDGAELPAGEVGTLEIRGPNLFRGYWGLPEKTTEEMRGDGFFVTGDLASVDGEGRVTLVGRGKDLVIAGGFNVYPKEVEDRLDEVAGVAESAVIGAPHADLGEGVVAVLVAEAEPVEDCTARTLSEGGHYLGGSLEETIEEIRAAGGDATAFACDVSEYPNCERLVNKVRDALGPVEVLINNAALTYFIPVVDFPINKWHRSTAVNFHAPFYLSKLVLPGMIERGAGSIVNVSSGAAIGPGRGPYKGPQFAGGRLQHDLTYSPPFTGLPAAIHSFSSWRAPLSWPSIE